LQQTATQFYERSQGREGIVALAWKPERERYLFGAIDLPFTRNNNPGGANTAPTSDRFDPKVQLNFGHPFTAVMFTAVATLEMDRYSEEKAKFAESNKLQGAFTADFDQAFKSTIAYLVYQPTFARSKNSDAHSQLNDFGIGARSKKINWSLFVLGYDVNLTRRYSNAGSDSDSASLKSSISYAHKEVAATFAPSIRWRVFDNSDRQDKVITLPLKVSWNPRSNNYVDVILTINPVRNYSTVKSQDSRQVDAGPTIHVVIKL
jgi:hypothetical protein